MSWWEALILGLVQGLTEYLPVSSSGHLILVAWLLGLREGAQMRAAMNTFDIVLHLGTIVAVAGVYWQRVLQMGRGVLGRDRVGLRLAGQLMLGLIPVSVVGLLFKDAIRSHLYGPWPIIAALVAGGVLMLIVAWHPKLERSRRGGTELEQIGWVTALLIGLAQCVALWPGTSRAMMTVVVALILGLRGRAAAEFSFLLGLVTIASVTAYQTMETGPTMIRALEPMPVLIGFVAATVSAALAMRWFVDFLTRRGLGPFGWYRIGLGALLAGLLIGGVVGADMFAGAEPGARPEAPASNGETMAAATIEPGSPDE